jgi:hypothetical protein
MNITVTVLDANGEPIQAVQVALNFYHDTTNAAGVAHFLAPSEAGRPPAFVTEYIITFFHPDYVREQVNFEHHLQDSKYNNPLLERTVTSDDSHGHVKLFFTMCLGRYSSAPTKRMPDSEMTALAQRKGDVGAVWLDPQDGKLTYRGSFFYRQQVELAEQFLAPKVPPPADAAGWRRFNSAPATSGLDPQNEGRFYWILCPASNQPDQMAALVWSPNIKQNAPPKSLDMVVFYSPSTGDYPPKYYPFGCVMRTGNDQPPQPDQSYMGLGQKYLEREFCFLYQLIGRKKSAVIVMPICKHGAWNQFLAAEGVFRLCREVCLFLHRECRTSNMSLSSVGGVDPNVARAGASLRSPGAGYSALGFGSPPSPGILAVSFFSFGAAPAKQVMRYWSLAESLQSATAKDMVSKAAQSISAKLWGCPDAAAQNAFVSTWREWWDMDGFHPNSGGWEECLKLLNGWMAANSDRVIRMCHSSGRSPRYPEAELKAEQKTGKAGLWTSLLGSKAEKVTERRYNVPGIQEIHGNNWSVCAIDNSYISGLPPGGLAAVGNQVPALVKMPWEDLDGAAHHATPKVAFSNFVALSSMGGTGQGQNP